MKSTINKQWFPFKDVRRLRRRSGFTGSGQQTVEPVPTWARVCLFYLAYLKSEQMIPVSWNGLETSLGIQGRDSVGFPTGELLLRDGEVPDRRLKYPRPKKALFFLILVI